ncbi:hypothetical protein DPEC_G00317420 [Dallia pectoralis]|uniref:Uncharacterized protein n=1 Tax=Dallia pectoralis TaxID=75939 RepID=A0ACC2FD49_DALPE|nr:hypothetical protein DPEC_G00317420 [Dallia pectoralis]
MEEKIEEKMEERMEEVMEEKMEEKMEEVMEEKMEEKMEEVSQVQIRASVELGLGSQLEFLGVSKNAHILILSGLKASPVGVIVALLGLPPLGAPASVGLRRQETSGDAFYTEEASAGSKRWSFF